MYQGLVALCFVEREGGGTPLPRHRAWNFGFLNAIKLVNEKFNPGTGGGGGHGLRNFVFVFWFFGVFQGSVTLCLDCLEFLECIRVW